MLMWSMILIGCIPCGRTEQFSKNNDFNMDMLEEIVRSDDKQRYSFNEDKTLIRANQGHSIPVDVELERVD